MARLFTTGFEMGDGLSLTSLSTATIVAAVTGMSGSYNLQCNNATAYKTVTASGSLYIRVRFRSSGTGNYVCLWGAAGTVLGSVKFNSSAGLTALVSTATVVATGVQNLLANTTYLFEIYVSIANSGGRIIVKVDGVTDIDYTGDTQPGADTTIDRVSFQGVGGNPVSNYDDLAINDTTGSAPNNTWCGDGHIIAIVPNADGDSSQLVGSDGNSTSNYLLVDETPANGDTDYNTSSTAEQYDLYGLSASGLGTVTITRVWAEARARDTVAAGGLCRVGIKTGSTESWSADLSLLTTYTLNLQSLIQTVNPESGVAWTVSDVDALQAGFKVR